jgi:hypothetical protein
MLWIIKHEEEETVVGRKKKCGMIAGERSWCKARSLIVV